MHHTKGSENDSILVKAWIAMLAIVLVPCAFGQRTQLKPGFNLFTPQQDIELGQQVAQDAEKQLPMLNNPQVDKYLSDLGKRLALKAPGEKYPYQFKCVNDPSINAFALPGGFLFINRGTIEAADNEAELAGVVGHEIGHVALRHGTNQASKSQLAQMPLAILGVMGGNSVGALIARIGTGFAVNSVLLKYSRDDERQADLIGTQILYDLNYDPTSMAKFFEKLGSKGGTDFFSSHPNPENRIQNINVEIGKLGGRSATTADDSSEFRNIRQLVKSLQPAPKQGPGQPQTSGAGQEQRPASPSSRPQSFTGNLISLRYPDNWKAYEGNEQAFTLAPERGILRRGNDSAVAYGASIAVFAPASGNQSGTNLKEATNQLIESLRNSNPAMRIVKDRGQIRVGGQRALSKILENESPLGGRETDWLVTVMRPEGLVYFVFVAPEQEFAGYQRTFQQILDSVKFTGR